MGAVTIRVKAYPEARKEVWQQVQELQFDAYVKEPAQDNRANKRIVTLIARHFSVPLQNVRMLTGARTRGKTFTVTLL
ncbi:MAG: DUF167 domain-containing protein [Minisyncoccia bacterium]